MFSSLPSMNNSNNELIENLYNRVTGDEDARVCRDIPESACSEQPRNFFAYLLANLLGKVADEIASAKLVIPWLFGQLGVPATLTGFLVPIREAGVLLPQLAVAAAVRHMAIRKTLWLAGSMLSALSLFAMAYAAMHTSGTAAGAIILLMLVVFSLSRGLCSVSAKDVLGKTVSKSRRGALMGWSASLSGIAVLLVGLWLSLYDMHSAGLHVFAILLTAGGLLWILATLAFARIIEQPGATEGGGNALDVALQHLKLLKTDAGFREFVIARSLLLSVALAPPFYVLIAQARVDARLSDLGILIIANGVATSISAPFWGYMGDKSSRRVMSKASLGAGLLGVFTFIACQANWHWVINPYGLAVIVMLLTVMHGGVRLGRKVYLVDMATAGNRAAYVAVSNTVIGVLMLLAGLIGITGDLLGPEATLFILGLISILAALYIQRLPDVSEP
jgi:hypothetical protein